MACATCMAGLTEKAIFAIGYVFKNLFFLDEIIFQEVFYPENRTLPTTIHNNFTKKRTLFYFEHFTNLNVLKTLIFIDLL